jgi:hypothetical protein
MVDRPILFSPSMVRALLSGRKTQTRRAVKPRLIPVVEECLRVNGKWVYDTLDYDLGAISGKPGDLLWVKEGWRHEIAHSHGPDACDCGDVVVTYKADGEQKFFSDHSGIIPDNWTMPRAAQKGGVTSLFMPRWASRLTLELLGVRVERLQEITETDAIAEGIEPVLTGAGERCGWLDYEHDGAGTGY